MDTTEGVLEEVGVFGRPGGGVRGPSRVSYDVDGH